MAYSKLYVTRNDKLVLAVDGLEKTEVLSIFFGENSVFDVFDDKNNKAVTGTIPAGRTLIVGKHECHFDDIS